jgi:hypothetical protein
MGPDPVARILNFPASRRGTEDAAPPRPSSQAEHVTTSGTDLLAEVDLIFEMRSRGLDPSIERQSLADLERTRLQEEFSTVCAQEIRPAMQAFLERLQMNGGGGLLEEHEGVQGAGVAPRIRLWMSLAGELIGRPRQDQHPYLQLDFDIDLRQVNVSEGDMGKGRGASGPFDAWMASEITGARVTEALLAVLRKAAG